MATTRGDWPERSEGLRQRRRTGVEPNTPVRDTDGQEDG